MDALSRKTTEAKDPLSTGVRVQNREGRGRRSCRWAQHLPLLADKFSSEGVPAKARAIYLFAQKSAETKAAPSRHPGDEIGRKESQKMEKVNAHLLKPTKVESEQSPKKFRRTYFLESLIFIIFFHFSTHFWTLFDFCRQLCSHSKTSLPKVAALTVPRRINPPTCSKWHEVSNRPKTKKFQETQQYFYEIKLELIKINIDFLGIFLAFAVFADFRPDTWTSSTAGLCVRRVLPAPTKSLAGTHRSNQVSPS